MLLRQARIEKPYKKEALRFMSRWIRLRRQEVLGQIIFRFWKNVLDKAMKEYKVS